jgi:hypothetical protein
MFLDWFELPFGYMDKNVFVECVWTIGVMGRMEVDGHFSSEVMPDTLSNQQPVQLPVRLSVQLPVQPHFRVLVQRDLSNHPFEQKLFKCSEISPGPTFTEICGTGVFVDKRSDQYFVWWLVRQVLGLHVFPDFIVRSRCDIRITPESMIFSFSYDDAESRAVYAFTIDHRYRTRSVPVAGSSDQVLEYIPDPSVDIQAAPVSGVKGSMMKLMFSNMHNMLKMCTPCIHKRIIATMRRAGDQHPPIVLTSPLGQLDKLKHVCFPIGIRSTVVVAPCSSAPAVDSAVTATSAPAADSAVTATSAPAVDSAAAAQVASSVASTFNTRSKVKRTAESMTQHEVDSGRTKTKVSD